RRRRGRAVHRRWLRGGRPASGKDWEAGCSSRIVWMRLERRDGYAQPVGERQGAEQISQFGLAVGAVQPDCRCSVADERPSPEPDEMPVLRELGRGGRLCALVLLHLRVRRAGGNLDLEFDQELHAVLLLLAVEWRLDLASGDRGRDANVL